MCLKNERTRYARNRKASKRNGSGFSLPSNCYKGKGRPAMPAKLRCPASAIASWSAAVPCRFLSRTCHQQIDHPPLGSREASGVRPLQRRFSQIHDGLLLFDSRVLRKRSFWSPRPLGGEG